MSAGITTTGPARAALSPAHACTVAAANPPATAPRLATDAA